MSNTTYLYSLYDTIQILDGNVGIGTLAPRQTLDIEGTLRTTTHMTDFLAPADPGSSVINVLGNTLSNLGKVSAATFDVGALASSSIVVNSISTDNASNQINMNFKSLSNLHQVSLSNITSVNGIVDMTATTLSNLTKVVTPVIDSTGDFVQFSAKSLSNIANVFTPVVASTTGTLEFSSNTLSNIAKVFTPAIGSATGIVQFSSNTLSNIAKMVTPVLDSETAIIQFSGKTLSNIAKVVTPVIDTNGSLIDFSAKGLANISTLNVSTSAFIGGTVTASNIHVIGDFTTLNTTTSNTEQLVINNAGTGPALQVIQSGAGVPVAAFYDGDSPYNATPALYVADGALIGFGTSTPATQLHAYHATAAVYETLETDGIAAAQVLFSSSNVSARVGAAADNTLVLGTDSAHPLVVTTNNAERMRVLSSGSIGIGLTAPAYPVDIAGRTRFNDVIVQSIGNMNLFRYAHGGVAYTNGNGKTLGVKLTWANTVSDDSLTFRVSFKMHLASTNARITYRMFEALVTPKDDAGNNKPIMLVEGNNNATTGTGFSSFADAGVRAAANSVDLSVTWNSTNTSYKGYVQIEVFAPTDLGNFTFATIPV